MKQVTKSDLDQMIMLRVPAPTKAALRQQAKSEGIKLSACVRLAIFEYLDKKKAA